MRASYEAALETVRGARRRARRGQPRVLAHAARARGLLPDRAGRGLREPGPLRRRALRPARARRRRLRDVRRDAPARLRARGQAPLPDRRLRALGGLLRRLLRPGAARAHADPARLRRRPSRSCDLLLTPTSPTVAFRIGELVDDPLAMYACDLFTLPVNLAGLPASRSRAGSPRACRSACTWSARPSARTGCWPPRTRSRARSRSIRAPPGADGCRMSVPGRLGGRDRPRDPRAAARRAARCSAAARTSPAASRTRASARSARRSPACCRWRTARPSSARSRSASRWAREIAAHSTFHRKNYFYPDSPKAYQISQYDEPLCSGGRLAVPTADGDDVVGFERVHLEEDAAKTIHEGGGGGRLAGSHGAVVDFNRCGTPLIEMVTRARPAHARAGVAASRRSCARRSWRSASRTATWRRARCASTPTSACGGPARTELRTKTELKNMNSFRFLERGIARELRRQAELYEAGERGRRRQTLHYDPARGRAHRAALEGAGARLPLLPGARPRADRALGGADRAAARARCPSCRRRACGASSATTRCRSPRRSTSASAASWRRYFEEVAAACGDARAAANWVLNEFSAHLNEARLSRGRVARAPGRAGGADRPRGRRHARLVRRQAGLRGARRGRGRRRPGRDRRRRAASARSPTQARSRPSSTRSWRRTRQQAEQFRGGKENLMGFFVGQVMKATGGRAEPQTRPAASARGARPWLTAPSCSRPARCRCRPRCSPSQSRAAAAPPQRRVRRDLRRGAAQAQARLPHRARRAAVHGLGHGRVRVGLREPRRAGRSRAVRHGRRLRRPLGGDGAGLRRRRDGAASASGARPPDPAARGRGDGRRDAAAGRRRALRDVDRRR